MQKIDTLPGRLADSPRMRRLFGMITGATLLVMSFGGSPAAAHGFINCNHYDFASSTGYYWYDYQGHWNTYDARGGAVHWHRYVTYAVSSQGYTQLDSHTFTCMF